MKKMGDCSRSDDSGLSMREFETESNKQSIEVRSHLEDWKQKVKLRVKQTCTVGLLRRRFPIVNWLPTYNRKFAINDAVAGITVGLTTIPQSIAYAALAGLPLQYGLYSAFMGLFVYVILGTVEQSSVGPTAVMSLMTFSYTNASGGGPAYSILLAFLAGWLELVVGLLNLGFVVEFISAPVISGFCSAAALTVSSTQVKGLFGLNFKASSFIDIWKGFFANITKCNTWDSALGCFMIIILLLMRKLTSLKNFGPLKKVDFLRNRFVDSCLWFISTSRNAIAVIAGCLAAYFLEQNGAKPFTLTGDIQSGLPPFALPSFSINRTVGNTTVVMGFGDICLELGTAIYLIPLIAILEQVAIAKAFASGKRTDATQEMVALGVGTILGSLFGSMPITASFGRSSVQAASGVKTPLTNIYGGILVLLALGFLMPSLAYIPKTVLASVIITSVIFMLELDQLKPLWKTNRVELIPFGITFFCCLLINMEYGILIGVAVHMFILGYVGTRPNLEVTRLRNIENNEESNERIVVKVISDLYFPGVEKFRSSLTKATNPPGSSLVIDLSNLIAIDYSSLKMLKSVADEYRKRNNVSLQFVNVRPNISDMIKCMDLDLDVTSLSKVDSNSSHEI